MRSFFIPVPSTLKGKSKLLLIASICWTIGAVVIILDELVSEKTAIARIFIGVCYIPLGIYYISKSRKDLKRAAHQQTPDSM